MNDQLLQQLANKLGTTADLLWSVLIRQAATDAVLDAGWALVWLIVAISMAFLGAAFSGKYDAKDEYNTNHYLVLGLLVRVLSVAMLFLSLGYLQEAYVASTNPQYWALHEVLKTFGK